jgi:hypothetical protein
MVSRESSAAQSVHDTVTELTRHYHEQIHQIDAQIGELEQQKAVIKAIAMTELNRSPELKEVAADQHENLVRMLISP